MNWSVEIERGAKKEIRKLPGEVVPRVAHAISKLAEHPASGRPLKGNFAGLRRTRVGGYPIIYQVLTDEQRIRVVSVMHRKESYRPRKP